MKLSTSTTTKLLAALICLLGSISQCYAQALELEPNDSCAGAQDFGSIPVPFVVDGLLGSPDIDFFRVSGAPGEALVADLEGEPTGAGTLSDPYLGLFDSGCSLLAVNDDSGSFNSHLAFSVPVDGVFILAASSCCDSDFTGNGGSEGTYQLAISPLPPSISSISGRVVDLYSGAPLSGSDPPFASVELRRCAGDECFESVGFKSTDSDGRFEFTRDDIFDGLLPAGTYAVTASASEYESGTSGPFDVGGDEDFDRGDIPLSPPPVIFSDIQACDDFPDAGGTCEYSVKIENNTPSRLRGLAWSRVEGSFIGSRVGFTTFEATRSGGYLSARRERVYARPFSADVVRFRFAIPSSVQNGAFFCTRLFFGLDPDPLVNTVREGDLFCVSKNATGFDVLSDTESRKIFQSIKQESRAFRGRRPVIKP